MADRAKAKNIRSMLSDIGGGKNKDPLKDSVEKDQQEISFNITPDEDEIRKYNNPYRGNNEKNDKRESVILTDEDPFKYETVESDMSSGFGIAAKKQETRDKVKKSDEANTSDLMERTRKIIENIDGYNTKKLSDKSVVSKLRDKDDSIAKTQRSIDLSNLNNKEDTDRRKNPSPTVIKGNITSRSGSVINEEAPVREATKKQKDDDDFSFIEPVMKYSGANQRVIDKIKQNGNLEKELKEKTHIIQILNEKIDAQKLEIAKLKSDNDGTKNSWKLECVRLQEHFSKTNIEALSKISQLEVLARSYKDQIEDYSLQLEAMSIENESLHKTINSLEKEAILMEEKYKNLKASLLKQNEALETKVYTLILKIKTLYTNTKIIKGQNKAFIENIKYYFESSPIGEETEKTYPKNDTDIDERENIKSNPSIGVTGNFYNSP